MKMIDLYRVKVKQTEAGISEARDKRNWKEVAKLQVEKANFEKRIEETK